MSTLAFIIAVAVAQPLVSDTGFQSTAQMAVSGTADFTCGNSDPLPDGGPGPYSRYCLWGLYQSPWYDGFHGDLTISPMQPRYAGWIVFIQNPAFGGSATLFRVDWKGLVTAKEGFEVDSAQSGGGLSNRSSYLALTGNSGSQSVPNVIMAGTKPDYDPMAWGPAYYNAGAYRWAVRNDGTMWIGGQLLAFHDDGGSLSITKELPDGGVLTTTLPWNQP